MNYFEELPLDMFPIIFDYLTQTELLCSMTVSKLIYNQINKYIDTIGFIEDIKIFGLGYGRKTIEYNFKTIERICNNNEIITYIKNRSKIDIMMNSDENTATKFEIYTKHGIMNRDINCFLLILATNYDTLIVYYLFNKYYCSDEYQFDEEIFKSNNKKLIMILLSKFEHHRYMYMYYCGKYNNIDILYELMNKYSNINYYDAFIAGCIYGNIGIVKLFVDKMDDITINNAMSYVIDIKWKAKHIGNRTYFKENESNEEFNNRYKLIRELLSEYI